MALKYIGRILHSNVTCANIIDHISKEMQNKIMQEIIEMKQEIFYTHR